MLSMVVQDNAENRRILELAAPGFVPARSPTHRAELRFDCGVDLVDDVTEFGGDVASRASCEEKLYQQYLAIKGAPELCPAVLSDGETIDFIISPVINFFSLGRHAGLHARRFADSQGSDEYPVDFVVVLKVPSVERARDFYVDGMGLLQGAIPVGAGWGFDCHPLMDCPRAALCLSDLARNKVPPRTWLRFRVPELAIHRQRLDANRMDYVDSTAGGGSIRLRDPFGNLVEFIETHFGGPGGA